ncbi:MAG: hypothetical protein ACM3PY_12295, partial [Omnitrophica WOR_2 bacterium]
RSGERLPGNPGGFCPMSRSKHRLSLTRIPPGVFNSKLSCLPLAWRYYSTNFLAAGRLEKITRQGCFYRDAVNLSLRAKKISNQGGRRASIRLAVL